KAAPEHYARADGVTGYKTQDTLSFPLRCQDRVVGVLQLLNKQGSDRFGEDDFSNVERFSSKLALKVDEFARIPENLETLGIVPQRNMQHATIMFCDLTASATLFQE